MGKFPVRLFYLKKSTDILQGQGDKIYTFAPFVL